jgi:hypothetical protein
VRCGTLAARTPALVVRHRDYFDPPFQMRRQFHPAGMRAVAFGHARFAGLGVAGREVGLLGDFLGRHARLALEQLELPVAQLLGLRSVLLEVEQSDHFPEDPDLAPEALVLGTFPGDEGGDGVAQIGRKLGEIDTHLRLRVVEYPDSVC